MISGECWWCGNGCRLNYSISLYASNENIHPKMHHSPRGTYSPVSHPVHLRPRPRKPCQSQRTRCHAIPTTERSTRRNQRDWYGKSQSRAIIIPKSPHHRPVHRFISLSIGIISHDGPPLASHPPGPHIQAAIRETYFWETTKPEVPRTLVSPSMSPKIGTLVG